MLCQADTSRAFSYDFLLPSDASSGDAPMVDSIQTTRRTRRSASMTVWAVGGDRCTRGVRKTKIGNRPRYRRNTVKHGKRGGNSYFQFSKSTSSRRTVEKWRETVEEETTAIALI